MGQRFQYLAIYEGILGEGSPNCVAMQNFNNCIEACNMSDVPTWGNFFIWCNGQSGQNQTWQVLDRVLQSASLSCGVVLVLPFFITNARTMPLFYALGFWNRSRHITVGGSSMFGVRTRVMPNVFMMFRTSSTFNLQLTTFTGNPRW